MVRVLSEKAPIPGREGAQRHAVRYKALCILSHDVVSLARTDAATFAEIPRVLGKVIGEDPDNTELALRILALPAFASRRGGPIEALTDALADTYAPGLLARGEAMLVHSRRPDDGRTSLMGVAADWLPQVVKIATLRLEAGEPALVRRLAPRAWDALRRFPEDTLAGVKNRRLYNMYLTGIVAESLALMDLAWAQHPPLWDVTLAETAEVQLAILGSLPPGTEKLRLSILLRLEKGLGEEAKAPPDARGRGAGRLGGGPGEGVQGSEAARQGACGQAPGHAPGGAGSPALTLIEVLGTRHRESVIDSARMQGRGRPNAAIQVSHAGIFRILGQQKVAFETLQI